MTQEQRIRGKDSGVDWVILVTGYDEKAVARITSYNVCYTKLLRDATAASRLAASADVGL